MQSSETTTHTILLRVLNDCHIYGQHHTVHLFAPDKRSTLDVERDTSSLAKSPPKYLHCFLQRKITRNQETEKPSQSGCDY